MFSCVMLFLTGCLNFDKNDDDSGKNDEIFEKVHSLAEDIYNKDVNQYVKSYDILERTLVNDVEVVGDVVLSNKELAVVTLIVS